MCNLAIARYANVTVTRGGAPTQDDHQFFGDRSIAAAALRRFRMTDASVSVRSDFPLGAGLGGSSAVGVAAVAALAAARGETMNPTALAELSREIEIADLDVPGGRQDHYAAAYGGALGLRFSAGKVDVRTIPLSSRTRTELERRCIIVYTGQSRISGDTITAVMNAYRQRDAHVLEALKRMRETAEQMPDALAVGQRRRARRARRRAVDASAVAASSHPNAGDRRDRRARERGGRGRRAKRSAHRAADVCSSSRAPIASIRFAPRSRRSASCCRSRSTRLASSDARSARRRRRADARARRHRFAKSVVGSERTGRRRGRASARRRARGVGIPRRSVRRRTGTAECRRAHWRRRHACARRPLMFNGHIDVVDVDGMVHAPWDSTERDGRIYGRGSSDMKAGVATMCAAAARAAEAQPGASIVVAAVADEEFASLGTRALIARGVRANAAIVTEPTRLAIMPAHLGFVWADVVTHGRAAHGSRWDIGVDAIRHAGLVLAELDRFDSEELPTRTIRCSAGRRSTRRSSRAAAGCRRTRTDARCGSSGERFPARRRIRCATKWRQSVRARARVVREFPRGRVCDARAGSERRRDGCSDRARIGRRDARRGRRRARRRHECVDGCRAPQRRRNSGDLFWAGRHGARALRRRNGCRWTRSNERRAC